MARMNVSSWAKNGGEGDYEGTPQRNKNKISSTSNAQLSHSSVPASTSASQLMKCRPHGIIRLPTNVFVQIATYLQPKDLLFLARATKQFRRVLMARSSAYIWRSALEKPVGLPPCPTIMSEPLYVALLFTEDCSRCWRHTTSTLDTDHLVRHCAQCQKETANKQKVPLNRPHGQNLAKFLKQKKADDKKAKKFERQTEITRRLTLDGWSAEDMVLPKKSKEHGQWASHFNKPEALKESEWPALHSKLTAILERNLRERRKGPRRTRLEALWGTVKSSLAKSAKTNDVSRTLASVVSEVSRITPIPEFSDVLGWPIIKELLDTNRSVPEMEARFVQQRPAIDREVSAWCSRIKTSLADTVRKSLVEHGVQVPTAGVIANNSFNSPLHDLTPETQLLVRADTIFAPYSQYRHWNEPSLQFCGYATYMRSLRQWTGYGTVDKPSPISVDRFQIHPTAPDIVRALLTALGKPLHTTTLELGALNERFICGRCDDDQPKSWAEMVKYYLDRQEEWGNITRHMDWFTRNNVAARDIHDLKSDNPKPLIRLFSPKDQPSSTSGSNPESETPDYVILCGPCLRASYNAKPMTRLQAMYHLREMHEISEPRLGDLGVDLWKPKRWNYRVIPVDCLMDGEFVHDNYDRDSWWEAGSERGSTVEDGRETSTA